MPETLPSYVRESPVTPKSGFAGTYNDNSLRFGRIVKTYLPSDADNISKKHVEYDISCMAADGASMYSDRIYAHAVVINALAGFADKASFTLRELDKSIDYSGTDKAAYGYGSMVLFACINGNTRQPVILGGLQSPLEDAPATDIGHNALAVFNGVSITINKDGDLSIVRGGPTNADGTPVNGGDNSKTAGAAITMSKDGSLSIKSGGSSAQTITLDQTGKKLSVVAGSKGIDIKTDGPTTITTGDVVTIKASNVKVNSASEAWVKGKTYIQAEMQMWQAVLPAVTTIAAALQGLSTACSAAPLTPIGAALKPIAIQMNNASSAIQQFISKQQSFLSSKHGFSD